MSKRKSAQNSHQRKSTRRSVFEGVPLTPQGAAFIEVVENQLRENTPPEVKQTFERLVADRYSVDDAKRLIANILVQEVFTIMKQQKPFDEARYVAGLHQLPEIPDDYGQA